ncbi:MAG TPA: GNAT family N-acetyltransferase [Treponema sp.]|nr:GNAT family N-acetyltransferase [Treponema sp.]
MDDRSAGDGGGDGAGDGNGSPIKYTLRNETVSDYREVEELTREAFWNLYVPGCDEHFLVHKMRSHPDFIPEMDFVAVAGKKIIGCIMFTKSYIQNGRGDRLGTLTFGPVCVSPDFQRMGIGSALIRKGIEKAKEDGYPAIIILGDPRNYCRHGFRNSKDYGISNGAGRFPYAQLALILDSEKLVGTDLRFFYSEVFSCDHDEAAIFDASFPNKEMRHESSQDIFSIQCRAFVDD